MKYIFYSFLFCILCTGCSSRSTFVLLPDNNGSVGEIVVTNAKGSQALNKAGQSFSLSANSRPGEVRVMDKSTIDSVFGEAILLQPNSPTKFILYFWFDSIRLRPDSQKKFAEILEVIQEEKSLDISVNGHTDRAGSSKYNYTLSLKRAEFIANKLVKAGVDQKYIYTTSHGEGNPLVITADNKPKLRNRRVEVIVR